MPKPANRAAWLNAPKAHPFEVKEAFYTQPKASQLVIHVKAAAINPADHFCQAMAPPFLTTYPYICGSDIAGVVAEVGSNVTHFKVGDRVIALPLGCFASGAPEGGFQDYAVVEEGLTAALPENVSFVEGSAIPLCLATAAAGLFPQDHLKLPLPKSTSAKTGKVVLVYSAATSVGCNAVQLAVAAGCKTIATCSTKNFELIKKLGASEVYDYNDAGMVEQVVDAVKRSGDDFMGCLDCMGRGGALEKCAEIMDKVQNGRKFISTVLPPGTYDASTVPAGVEHNGIWSIGIMQNEVGNAVLKDYLPGALAEGRYVCAPPVEVVGHGLESVQEAVDRIGRGVSAKKLVVTL